MTLRPDVTAEYGVAGGPLPKRGGGSFSVWFWRAYDRGDTGVGLDKSAPETLAGEAFAAGLKRRAAEPGLIGQDRE